MRLILSAYFLFLFFTLSFGQELSLPLYERTEKRKILLHRIDSVPKDVKNKFDTVSIVSTNGICYGKLGKFKLITVKECCTKPDPKFLIASAKFKNKKCSGVMIFGKIDSGKSFNYDSLKTKTNLFEWTGEDYQKPLVSEEYVSKYRWRADELDGKKDVYLEAMSKNNNKDYPVIYKVPLKGCIHIKTDSLDYFYCETDTSANSKKKSLNWYDDKIYWSLLYVKKELVYVTPDFSDTSIDGYSPFHYKEQKLFAVYNAKGITYYVFSPGYVIYYKNKKWNYGSRNPVKYYGECDCPQ